MKLDSVNQVAVIGTGMIGASMAVLFTGNGYPTTMLAISDAEAQAGINRYEEYYRDLIAKGLVNEGQAKACRSLLRVVQSYGELAQADFILECVVERLEVKYQVYAEIETHCNQFQALASSTSALSADDLCGGLAAREKLVVAHPYNPPHLVPCVEVVGSAHTAPATVRFIESLFRSVGREPVVMQKGAPGFIANRLQHALYREAVYMVEQGIATPEAIDRTLMTSFAPRYTSIGMFEHFDYAGLDMVVSIEDYLFPTLCTAAAAQGLVRERLEAGDLGCKTGRGILDWSGKDMEDFRKRASEPYLRFFNWSVPEEE